MAKQAHTKIAEHLGWDAADVREGRYQETRFDRPVYVCGGDYYAAGPRAPRERDGQDMKWKQEISRYDGASIIWRANPDA
jgi:hypothetical protein